MNTNREPGSLGQNQREFKTGDKISMSLKTTEDFIQNERSREILSVIEDLKPSAIKIGEGKNADVFSVELENYSNICLKLIKKNPEFTYNDIRTEVEYQKSVSDLGIRTPQVIGKMEDLETKRSFIVMERIKGSSFRDIIEKKEPLSPKYNHEYFFKKLNGYLNTMHNNEYQKIHHRDLHWGNIMVEYATGEPVIIDFGTATKALSTDDDFEIYNENVRVWDPQEKKFTDRGKFYKDRDLVSGLQKRVKEWIS